jgi:hypothetical protein
MRTERGSREASTGADNIGLGLKMPAGLRVCRTGDAGVGVEVYVDEAEVSVARESSSRVGRAGRWRAT